MSSGVGVIEQVPDECNDVHYVWQHSTACVVDGVVMPRVLCAAVAWLCACVVMLVLLLIKALRVRPWL